MACQGETFDCTGAKLGQYTLNASQIARLTRSRDFRPNDEQRDEIVRYSNEWLGETGFEQLQYKTQYFETRPVNAIEKGLSAGIGTMRISWVYVPCSKMTVMAQQMQIENDAGRSEFVFRKWNPDKERVMWGSNNDSDRDPICPIPLLCCYLTEILCFRLVFNETVDHCGCGDKTA